MNTTHTALWQSLFGSAWSDFTKSVSEIGAFLLDHRGKTAETDRNSRRIADLDHAPTYDELSQLIDTLSEQKDIDAIQVIIAKENDNITAGFIRIRNEMTSELDSNLPLCTQARLISEMSNSKALSLLVLIQIEEYGNPKLSSSDISNALSVLFAALPEKALIAPASKERFWLYIPDFSDNKTDYLENLQKALKIGMQDENGRSRGFTFTAGCAADMHHPSQRMHSAEFTLFDATEKGTGSICLYSDDRYEQQKTEYDNMRRFTRLIDNNLFRYHFQPIVSARTGEIVAYEALMRTDKSINMFPLEILGAATKLGRMYDIEKATLRNTLQFISDNQNIFKDRKLFVNSIPAHILSSADWEALVQDYGELMEKVVIEMTEQSELDNDRIAIIHDRIKRSNMQLAIDDYGTGYSNTTNLLRYDPNYVKIDRSLIEGIDSKPKVQKLVTSLINFIHENGFSALAEGVETSEELVMMMRLGSDLIQGYYISKPKPFALHEITDALKNEIADINRLFSDDIAKVYHPEADEVVDLSRLSQEHYNSIFIENDNITIEGKRDTRYNITVTVKEKLKTKLTLRNACFITEKYDQCIDIGPDADVEMYLEGNNECIFRGIHVPKGAKLHLLGNGSLYIHAEMSSSFGIGTDKDNIPGNIIVESSGKLNIETNGENTIAIGGGKNSIGCSVRILSGDISIFCSGGNCIGIGNFEGDSVIDVLNCVCKIELNASNAIGIGSLTGKTDIYMANYALDVILSGLNLCAVGTINIGEGRVMMENGSFTGDMHGRVVNCIGSRRGSLNCSVISSNVSLYCEGGSVSGIGDISGSGDVFIKESSLDFCFLASEVLPIGSKNGTLTTENSTDVVRINE